LIQAPYHPGFSRLRFVVRAARDLGYAFAVQTLVEDFLQYLRHECGQVLIRNWRGKS